VQTSVCRYISDCEKSNNAYISISLGLKLQISGPWFLDRHSYHSED
jgi:hypothetical protein